MIAEDQLLCVWNSAYREGVEHVIRVLVFQTLGQNLTQAALCALADRQWFSGFDAGARLVRDLNGLEPH